MQALSPKPQQVKAWVLISPLDNPSCSIRYNTCNFNTVSMSTLPTSWAWRAGSCQTWVKSRIKEGQRGKGKKSPVKTFVSSSGTQLTSHLQVAFSTEPCRLCYTFIKLQHGKMSILRVRLRPTSTADLYRSSPASKHCLQQTSTQKGTFTELSRAILATQLENSQNKLWNSVSALLSSQFNKVYFFTRIWTSNITVKLGGTSL